MILSLSAFTSSKSRPLTASEPGRKLSTTTSARLARARTTSCPDPVFRSTAMLLLFLFAERKTPLSPLHSGGLHDRVSSPPSGNSTFTTSAPRSARSIVQNGPARLRVRSTTRMPRRASDGRVLIAEVYGAATAVDRAAVLDD